MTQPKRIQRKRIKGWKMPPNTVSVTRPGKWGNPYQIGERCDIVVRKGLHIFNINTSADAVRAYELFIQSSQGSYVTVLAPQELKGKDLACWCEPGQPCHADILLKLANEKR